MKLKLFSMSFVLLIAISSTAFAEITMDPSLIGAFEIKKAEAISFYQNPYFRKWVENVVSGETKQSFSTAALDSAFSKAVGAIEMAEVVHPAYFMDNPDWLASATSESENINIAWAIQYNYDYLAENLVTQNFDYGTAAVKTLVHEALHTVMFDLNIFEKNFGYDVHHCATGAIQTGYSYGDDCDCSLDSNSLIAASQVLQNPESGLGYIYDNLNDNDLDDDGIANGVDSDLDGDGCDKSCESWQGTSDENKDTDDDGIDDLHDEVPNTAGEGSDLDYDGLGDFSDPCPGEPDCDGDGVRDLNDEFPFDANDSKDSDGDGYGDNAEFAKGTDFENYADGIGDVDHDGIPDAQDSDMDGDGISNADESVKGTNPVNWDTDHDYIDDMNDVEPRVKNQFTDSDDDSIPDAVELKLGTNPNSADTDGDGYGDSEDKFPNDLQHVGDIDGDRIPNEIDPDMDGDGVLNEADVMPCSIMTQHCSDEDGDKLCMGVEMFLDIFSNGKLNATDDKNSDSDGDGLLDGEEFVYRELCKTDGMNHIIGYTLSYYISDPNKYDTDNNGVNDKIEVGFGCDPADPEPYGDRDNDLFANCYDTDSDGDMALNNDEKLTKGTVYEMNPYKYDTDEDGFHDGIDNCPSQKNPDQLDINMNGIGDACDALDKDGDSIPDTTDNCPDVPNADQADIDGDLKGNACDNCNNKDPDNNGNGIVDSCEGLDFDGDGISDGNDNCLGTLNPDQADADGDGKGDLCDADYANNVGEYCQVIAGCWPSSCQKYVEIYNSLYSACSATCKLIMNNNNTQGSIECCSPIPNWYYKNYCK